MIDPLLSANVYCSGLLDGLLAGAILPFRQALRRTSMEERCLLWTIRYSRRGEHLKVRLHGDPEDREALRQLFMEYVESYLETVRDAPSETPRTGRSDVPPIDPEDELPGESPDHSLLWTTYRRSHVSLGGSPWLEDDLFVAHATRCLARGCDLVLGAVSAMDGGSGNSLGARQKLLIKALLSGLGALGLGEPARAADYLRYHRGWLLRFFLDEEGKEKQVLEHFGVQADRMAATIEQMRRIAGTIAQTQGTQKREVPEAPEDTWEGALAGLAGYTGSFQDRADRADRANYQVDPFTSDVTFPPTFKVLHGLANQAGLPPLEEAYVHHLVLTAVQTEGVE